MNQYDKGYLTGQKDEAEVILENLRSLEDELNSVGWDSERSYLYTIINELEKFLND